MSIDPKLIDKRHFFFALKETQKKWPQTDHSKGDCRRF